MAEADKLNGLADPAEPLRKIARGVPMIERSIESEPDRLHGQGNHRQQPSTTSTAPNSPHLFPQRASNDLASLASEHLQLRTSAEHLWMLGSSAQQPAVTNGD